MMSVKDDDFIKYLTSEYNGELPPLLKLLVERQKTNPLPIQEEDAKLEKHRAYISNARRLVLLMDTIEDEYRIACDRAPIFKELTLEEFYEWAVTGQAKIDPLELHKAFFSTLFG